MDLNDSRVENWRFLLLENNVLKSIHKYQNFRQKKGSWKRIAIRQREHLIHSKYSTKQCTNKTNPRKSVL
jgi:hypothetical protein